MRAYANINEGLADYHNLLNEKWPGALVLFSQESFTGDEVNKSFNTGPYQKYPAYFVPRQGESANYGGRLIRQMLGVLNRFISSMEVLMHNNGGIINKSIDQVNIIQSEYSSSGGLGFEAYESKKRILEYIQQIRQKEEENATLYKEYKELKEVRDKVND